MNIKKLILDLTIGRPKTTFCLFLIFSILLVPGLLSIGTNFSYEAWYNPNDPSVLKLKHFEKTFGNDDSIIVLVNAKGSILTQSNLLALNDLSEDLLEVQDIIRVETLANFSHISSTEEELIIDDLVPIEDMNSFDDLVKEKILNKIKSNPSIKGDVISDDFSSVVLVGSLRPGIVDQPDNNEITLAVKEHLKTYKKNYPDLTFHLTGAVAVMHEFQAATLDDMSFLIPMLFFIFIAILYWRYRSLSAIGLVFTTMGFSSYFMLGFSGYFNIPIGTMTAAAPTILMTIALSDAVHIFSSFFLGLKNRLSYVSAVRYSLDRNFYPTLLTTFTTALGFFSFFDAKVKSVADLGIMVAIGTILAWIVTYFAQGPLMLIFSRFFLKYVIGDEKTFTPVANDKTPKTSEKLLTLLDKYKGRVAAGTVIFVIFGVWSIGQLEVNMDPSEQFLKSHPTVLANEALGEKFKYRSIYEAVVNSGEVDGAKSPAFLNKVDDFNKWLVKREGVSKVNWVGDIIRSVNRSLNNDNMEFYKIPKTKKMVAETLFLYNLGVPAEKNLNSLIDLENQRIRLTIFNDYIRSSDSLEEIKAITKEGKARGLDLQITGKTPLFHELTPYIVQTFVESFGIALFSITIVLIIALKSFKLGLLTLIPNVFPLIVGFTIYSLLGFEVDVGTVIIGSVCLGIAVDDSIHFLFEYKKWRSQGLDNFNSLRSVISTTFPALFMTTLLISVGFLSFLLGKYVPNMKFGGFSALILVVALISDFVILPAMLFLLDRKKT